MFSALALALALTGTALLVGGVDEHSLTATPLGWAIDRSSTLIFAIHVPQSGPALLRYRPKALTINNFAIAPVRWAIAPPPRMLL